MLTDKPHDLPSTNALDDIPDVYLRQPEQVDQLIRSAAQS